MEPQIKRTYLRKAMNQHIQKQIIEAFRKEFTYRRDGQWMKNLPGYEDENSVFIEKPHHAYAVPDFIEAFLKTSLERVWEEAEVNTITLLRDAIEETYGLELTSRIFRTLNEKVKAKSLKQTT